MKIEGFKKVDYPTLQVELKKMHDPNEASELQIAAQINLKSAQSVKNAFNETDQIVSDQVLTQICEVLKLETFVMWQNGERGYYIKNGKS